MELAGIMAGPSQAALSISPAIHNAAFRALRMEWLYVRLPVARGQAARAALSLVQSGFRGWNVTMPHKTGIMEALDALDESAESVGAVNTVNVQNGKTIGYNTDVGGLVRFLQNDAGIELSGIRAVIVGAGGAARAAVTGLSAGGAGSIDLVARDPAKAAPLAGIAGKAAFQVWPLDPSVWSKLEGCDLLINATPLGQLESPESEFDLSHMPPTGAVVDLVYHPAVTQLLQDAARFGLRAFGGLGMLVHQAALAFEIWTGREAPMSTMREAALEALGNPTPRPQAPA